MQLHNPVVRVQKIKPNLPKLILPPGNVGMEYVRPPPSIITPSPSPSPIPRAEYDVEIDPDNMVIPGSPMRTPSPSPSPIPPEDYEVEVDPDNRVIRAGGNSAFDFDVRYNSVEELSRISYNNNMSSNSSSQSNVAANNSANDADTPAYNEDLTSYKSHM